MSLSINQPSELPKKFKDISFTKKCILLTHICSTEPDKILLSPFSFLPVVRLYTANESQPFFAYTKISGIFCFLMSKDRKDYFFQIYSKSDFSLQFSISVNRPFLFSGINKITPNFFYLCFKYGLIGFEFGNAEILKKVLKIVKCENLDESIIEMNSNAIEISKNDNYSKFKLLVKLISRSLEKQNEELYNSNNNEKIEIYRPDNGISDFIIIEELLKLVGNIEYDEEDKVFNIFIDKKFDINLFQKFFKVNYYESEKNILPCRPIINDYINIKNRNNYINILVDHMMKNFNSIKEIIIKKRNLSGKANKSRFSDAGEMRSSIVIKKKKTEDVKLDNIVGEGIKKFINTIRTFNEDFKGDRNKKKKIEEIPEDEEEFGEGNK